MKYFLLFATVTGCYNPSFDFQNRAFLGGAVIIDTIVNHLFCSVQLLLSKRSTAVL